MTDPFDYVAATREAELRARHSDLPSGCHICFLIVQLDEARAELARIWTFFERLHGETVPDLATAGARPFCLRMVPYRDTAHGCVEFAGHTGPCR
jgi:hypothetical protein